MIDWQVIAVWERQRAEAERLRMRKALAELRIREALRWLRVT